MSNFKATIQRTLKETDFLQRTVPALQQWEVRDEDVMVHSLGVSAWNTLGHELGYQAIVECPAPTTAGDDIRSDSTWFDRVSRKPVAFVEFERYDGTEASKAKLYGKLSNLIEASHRWQTPSALLILVAWSKDVVSAPDIQTMTQTIRQGFKNSKGLSVPGRLPNNFLFCRF